MIMCLYIVMLTVFASLKDIALPCQPFGKSSSEYGVYEHHTSAAGAVCTNIYPVPYAANALPTDITNTVLAHRICQNFHWIYRLNPQWILTSRTSLTQGSAKSSTDPSGLQNITIHGTITPAGLPIVTWTSLLIVPQVISPMVVAAVTVHIVQNYYGM